MNLPVVRCDHFIECGIENGGKCAIDAYGKDKSISHGICMKVCTKRVFRKRAYKPFPKWKMPKNARRDVSANETRKLNFITEWPWYVRPILRFKQDKDAGLGDIIYRQSFPTKLREFIKKRIGKACGCESHAHYLNRHFPLRHRLVFHEETAGIGDAVALTVAVRELRKKYPDQFILHTHLHQDVWANNPDAIFGAPKVGGHKVNLRPFHCPDGRKLHFAERYLRNMCRDLGIPEFEPESIKPELYLTSREKDRKWLDDLGVPETFWVMMAGGNSAMTHKWWDPESYQAVVDHFEGRIQFVQAGHGNHDNFHVPLSGVINLVGKTNEARRFMSLIYHSSGVVCPVTSAMHIAAAFSKPGVIVGGGRENPFFYLYPGHIAESTVGDLDCCKTTGCMKYKCCVPAGVKDENACPHPVRISTRWRPVAHHQAKPRVGVFSLANDGWKPLRELTWPTMQAWCDRHGYEFVTETVPDPSRPPSWSKIPLLQKHIDRFDWVFWIDADAVVFDQESPLDAYLDNEADLVMAADDVSTINCGVMLMRSCPAIKKMLELIWDAPPNQWHHAWWEQESLRRMIGANKNPKHDAITKRLRELCGARMKLLGPQCELNCFQQWAHHMPSPLIVHAPGGDMNWKMEKLMPFVGGNKHGVVIPKCMDIIKPWRVIAAVESLLPCVASAGGA